MMRSLFSAVSGLKSHQTRMDVIGNNISNVNTEAFKASTVRFSEIMYQTNSSASAGDGATGIGGVNAKQIGLGVNVASTTCNVTGSGAAETTGNPFDLRLTDSQTTNFFVVSNGSGYQFTRAGSFYVDANGYLCMSSTGYVLQGWQVDQNTGEIRKTDVSPLQVMAASNQTSSPEATERAKVSGILDKTDTNITADGGYVMSLAFYDDLGYTYTAKFSITEIAEEATSNVYKEASNVPSQTELDSGYTKTESATFTDGTGTLTGIKYENKTAGGTSYAYIDGKYYELDSSGNNLVPVYKEASSVPSQTDLDDPAKYTKSTDATGTKYMTSTGGYFLDATDGKYYELDSSGNLIQKTETKKTPVAGQYNIKLTDVIGTDGLSILEENTDKRNKQLNALFNGSVDAAGNVTEGVGKTLVYDTNKGVFVQLDNSGEKVKDVPILSDTTTDTSEGKTTFLNMEYLYTVTDTTVAGTDVPQESNFKNIEIDFSDSLNMYNGGTSSLKSLKGVDGDGAGKKVGAMTGIQIDQTGKVYGSYDNGNTELLCQIAVAQFANASGLEKVGENCYQTTLNSGEFDGIGVEIDADGSKINSGELEMSNVDLSGQFTDMIITQRGFQANSRVITVSDTLLEELINLKR